MKDRHIAFLDKARDAATPGTWYACTFDPMEEPHLTLHYGNHHPHDDIARRMSKEDANLVAAAVNLLPELTQTARYEKALRWWVEGALERLDTIIETRPESSYLTEVREWLDNGLNHKPAGLTAAGSEQS